MLKRKYYFYLCLCFFIFFSEFVLVSLSWARPIVWMMPPPQNDGQSFRELFENPDQWTVTRSRIDVLGYADHWLASQFSDAELQSWFSQLNKWNLKLGLEVGAIKPWGQTGQMAFDRDSKKWDRFIADGAHIYAIAMDEPFSAARKLGMSPEDAIEQVAIFVSLVRQHYPDIQVGCINAYPGFREQEHIYYIDALQARLRQMNVRGLDFYRLDVDWMHFKPGDPIGQEGWQGVHNIELDCRQRGIPFSLIYWAANYPSLNRQGLATNETWDETIIDEGNKYAAEGGSPDEYVIESWVGTPDHSVPETTPGTFTQSVLDFSNHFLKN